MYFTLDVRDAVPTFENPADAMLVNNEFSAAAAVIPRANRQSTSQMTVAPTNGAATCAAVFTALSTTSSQKLFVQYMYPAFPI